MVAIAFIEQRPIADYATGMQYRRLIGGAKMETTPMSHEAAHTRWWQIFEVIVGLPFLAAIVLHSVIPLAAPPSRLTLIGRGGGVLLLIAGVAAVILARRELARHRQPTDPGQPTEQLVTTGVFGISRNPLYLGGAGVLLGIALAANLAWAVVLLVPSLVAAHTVLIVPEERYLAQRFGAAYAAYAATVCRWLGRRRRHSPVSDASERR